MRILIADDNEDNREMLSRRLIRRGYHVDIAVDGGEALSFTRDLRPDLVLMDVSMPVLSGLDATREIRKSPDIAQTPVIALTAHASPADKAEALSAGCDDFATKPFDFKALVAMIERYRKGPEA